MKDLFGDGLDGFLDMCRVPRVTPRYIPFRPVIEIEPAPDWPRRPTPGGWMPPCCKLTRRSRRRWRGRLWGHITVPR